MLYLVFFSVVCCAQNSELLSPIGVLNGVRYLAAFSTVGRRGVGTSGGSKRSLLQVVRKCGTVGTVSALVSPPVRPRFRYRLSASFLNPVEKLCRNWGYSIWSGATYGRW